jgi:hypothetical protein
MHSIVVLQRDGELRISLEAQDSPVERQVWEAYLISAVTWLRAVGGGSMVVHHKPGSLR